MKDQYYRDLGLEPGASQKDIKRAYFKLVRQFSPEKEPERFRIIREAYEKLQESSEEEGPNLPEPSEPFAKKWLEQILVYQRTGDEIMYRNACEEAHRYFPNELIFLYKMVQAQRRTGNTGKAVKNAEILVKKDAGNKWFRRELALSYMERGYTRKAFQAFDKAYELGCRDNDFLITYSILCNEYEEFEKGINILFEVVDKKQKWTAESQQENVEAFLGMITMSLSMEGKRLTEILDKFMFFLKQHPGVTDDFAKEMIMALGMITVSSIDLKEEERGQIQELLSLLGKKTVSDEVKAALNYCRMGLILGKIEKDSRIGDTLKSGIQSFLFMEDDVRLKKYAMMDTELCMLKEREEILPQLDVLEEDYPEYYSAMEEFAQRLRKNENLEYTKNRILKEYIRLNEECDGGFYFEKYPEEKPASKGGLVYSGDNEMPYVRSGKKIGRNDPCPCGSGKKYKQCCGR